MVQETVRGTAHRINSLVGVMSPRGPTQAKVEKPAPPAAPMWQKAVRPLVAALDEAERQGCYRAQARRLSRWKAELAFEETTDGDDSRRTIDHFFLHSWNSRGRSAWRVFIAQRGLPVPRKAMRAAIAENF